MDNPILSCSKEHETFIKELKDGTALHYLYTEDKYEGAINIWKYNDEFILTWEECEQGNQYNESSYTKDDRFTFKTVEEVLVFLGKKTIPVEGFEA